MPPDDWRIIPTDALAQADQQQTADDWAAKQRAQVAQDWGQAWQQQAPQVSGRASEFYNQGVPDAPLPVAPSPGGDDSAPPDQPAAAPSSVSPSPTSLQSPAPSAAPAAAAPPPAASGTDWLSVAQSQLGKPYIWGSAGGRSDFSDQAAGFDCSGFVSYVMQKGFGVNLPAFTGSAYQATTPISAQDARPGDVVLYNMSNPDPHIQHIAIYLGNGQVIQAGGTRNDVNIASVGNAGSYEFRRPAGLGNPTHNALAQDVVASQLPAPPAGDDYKDAQAVQGPPSPAPQLGGIRLGDYFPGSSTALQGAASDSEQQQGNPQPLTPQQTSTPATPLLGPAGAQPTTIPPKPASDALNPDVSSYIQPGPFDTLKAGADRALQESTGISMQPPASMDDVLQNAQLAAQRRSYVTPFGMFDPRMAPPAGEAQDEAASAVNRGIGLEGDVTQAADKDLPIFGKTPEGKPPGGTPIYGPNGDVLRRVPESGVEPGVNPRIQSDTHTVGVGSHEPLGDAQAPLAQALDQREFPQGFSNDQTARAAQILGSSPERVNQIVGDAAAGNTARGAIESTVVRQQTVGAALKYQDAVKQANLLRATPGTTEEQLRIVDAAVEAAKAQAMLAGKAGSRSAEAAGRTLQSFQQTVVADTARQLATRLETVRQQATDVQQTVKRVAANRRVTPADKTVLEDTAAAIERAAPDDATVTAVKTRLGTKTAEGPNTPGGTTGAPGDLAGTVTTTKGSPTLTAPKPDPIRDAAQRVVDLRQKVADAEQRSDFPAILQGRRQLAQAAHDLDTALTQQRAAQDAAAASRPPQAPPDPEQVLRDKATQDEIRRAKATLFRDPAQASQQQLDAVAADAEAVLNSQGTGSTRLTDAQVQDLDRRIAQAQQGGNVEMYRQLIRERQQALNAPGKPADLARQAFAEQDQAAATQIKDAAQQMRDLAKYADFPGAPDDVRQGALRLQERINLIASKAGMDAVDVRKSLVQAGMGRILTQSAKDQGLLESTVKAMGALDPNDPRQLQRFLQAARGGPTWLQYVREYTVMNLLSSVLESGKAPLSHLMYVGGEMLGVPLDLATSRLVPGAQHTSPQEVTALFSGARGAAKDALQRAWDIEQYGSTRQATQNALELGSTRGAQGDALSQLPGPAGALMEKLGQVTIRPMHAFYEMLGTMLNGALTSQMAVHVAQQELQAGRLQGSLSQATARVMAEPWNYPQVIKAASEHTRDAMLQSPDKITGIMNSLKSVGDNPSLGGQLGSALAQQLFPIFTVPYNAIKKGLLLSPPGTALQAGLTLAERDPEKQVRMLRSVLAGSVFTALGVEEYANGHLTGGNSRNGQPAYSWQPGGVGPHLNLDALPMGIPFAMTADALDNAQRTNEWSGLAAGAARGAVSGVAQTPLIHFNVLGALAQAGASGRNFKPPTADEAAMAVERELHARGVPASALLAFLAKVGDSVSRKPRDAAQQFEAGIPGLRQNADEGGGDAPSPFNFLSRPPTSSTSGGRSVAPRAPRVPSVSRR